MEHFKGNPIDNLAPIAAAGIPIISVCGDSEQTVPYKENMDVVRSRYLAAGGPVEVILKKECDHHPHSLDNPEPVVDFILRQQPESSRSNRYLLLPIRTVYKGNVAVVVALSYCAIRPFP